MEPAVLTSDRILLSDEVDGVVIRLAAFLAFEFPGFLDPAADGQEAGLDVVALTTLTSPVAGHRIRTTPVPRNVAPAQ